MEMIDTDRQLDELIHNQLLPTLQMFRSYEQLAQSDFRFSPKIFRKCAIEIQEVILIARECAGRKEQK